MTGTRHAITLVIGLFALALAGTAQAQEDLSAGKSPEQLFRLNCVMCHKSAQGLAAAGEKAGGLFGLESFLAQHYTASGRSAQAIAGYLKSVGGTATAHRDRRRHRDEAKSHKPAAKTETAKRSDKKSDKSSEPSDKMTTGSVKADEPKADKPAMMKPKPATADEKKSASSSGQPSSQAKSSEAKREKPAGTEKKTD